MGLDPNLSFHYKPGLLLSASQPPNPTLLLRTRTLASVRYIHRVKIKPTPCSKSDSQCIRVFPFGVVGGLHRLWRMARNASKWRYKKLPLKMIMSLAEQRGSHWWMWRRARRFSPRAAAALAALPLLLQQDKVMCTLAIGRLPPADPLKVFGGEWGRLFLERHRQHAPFALASELVLPPRLCFPVAGKHLHPEIDSNPLPHRPPNSPSISSSPSLHSVSLSSFIPSFLFLSGRMV